VIIKFLRLIYLIYLLFLGRLFLFMARKRARVKLWLILKELPIKKVKFGLVVGLLIVDDDRRVIL
jgi:hypothetical protein